MTPPLEQADMAVCGVAAEKGGGIVVGMEFLAGGVVGILPPVRGGPG
jgi:hypothetical protein